MILAQPLDEAHEAFGAVRIEARGGLVQDQQVGRQRERPGERHALHHAARQVGRQQLAVARLELDLGELGVHDGADLVFFQSAALAQREGDIVVNGQRGVQRAVLEQHAHAPARVAHLLDARILPGHAEHARLAAGGPLEPQDHAQQLRLAAARAADQRQHFVAPHLQVEVAVQHHAGPDRIDQVLDLDDETFDVRLHGPPAQPTLRSMMAKIASSTITPVIAATTERVTPTARLSVFGSTRRP